MKAEHLNALGSAVIACATVIGLMVGFYYNLRASKIRFIYIVVLELLFIITLGMITWWLRKQIQRGD